MRSNEKAALKSRIHAIRDRLPSNYKVIFVDYYPEYNTVSGVNMISNTVSGLTKHTEIVDKLEELFGNGGRYWADMSNPKDNIDTR